MQHLSKALRRGRHALFPALAFILLFAWGCQRPEESDEKPVAKAPPGVNINKGPAAPPAPPPPDLSNVKLSPLPLSDGRMPVPGESLVARYTFEGAEAGEDASGRRNFARLGAGQQVKGYKGGGLFLDGSADGFLDLGRSADFNIGKYWMFTFGCWFDRKSDDGTLLAFANGDGKKGGLIRIRLVEGKIEAQYREDDSQLFVLAPEGRLHEQWGHVALGRTIAYLDEGPVVRVGLFLNGFTAKLEKVPGGSITTTTRVLGNDVAAEPGRNAGFHGVIDDVRFYQRAWDDQMFKREP